jgi:hypothetical protein
MSLTFTHLSKKPLVFLRLTGLSVPDFLRIYEDIKPLWHLQIELKKKRPGRSAKLKNLKDKLLCLLVYYRCYITHEFLGYLFHLHNSNVSRLFKRLEPLLAKKITIKKDEALTEEVLINILIDVTEQGTQRPRKKQKKFYSGKKKRHTLKTEIILREDGKILAVSRTAKGRVHDFRMRKEGKPLPNSTKRFVDLGYQGLQKLCSHVSLPFRRKKGVPLTPEQRAHNRKQSSFRSRVEHKFRQLKIFKILSDTYRNFQKKHYLRFLIS